MSQSNATVNKEYKSSLFARIFSEPEAALSLYNSLNGTDYDDPAGLEINTIESVLYIGWKNDVSFLIGSDMNLYEHQATWNPNMPLRGLFYFADLYRGYVSSRSLDIYASVPLKLPAPRYAVFYNGTREEPERLELRLSSLFLKKDGAQDAPAPSSLSPKKDRAQGAPPALECTAQVLNINFGHNRELMGRCRKLYEYSYFIDAVRRHLREGLTLGAAVDRTADECIAGDILKEFLLKHRAEVANMVMPEFDAELHDRTTREIGYNEGYDEGRTAGIAEGKTAGIAEGKVAGIAEGRTAGIAEGKAVGKAGTICDMLSDICLLPEVWRGRIMAERDIDTLDTWVRIARRAGSLEEFLTKAGLET